MLKNNSQFSINVRAWDPSFGTCTKLGCFGSPTSWLCKGYCQGDVDSTSVHAWQCCDHSENDGDGRASIDDAAAAADDDDDDDADADDDDDDDDADADADADDDDDDASSQAAFWQAPK